MGTAEAQLLQTVTTQTQSDLVYFFVIAAAVMIIVLVPVYGMIMTDRKERRKSEQLRNEAEGMAENARLDRYIQREAQIMQVIKENSEVIAGLKITLENSGSATNRSLDRILERIDGIYKESEEIRTKLAVINNLLDNSDI